MCSPLVPSVALHVQCWVNSDTTIEGHLTLLKYSLKQGKFIHTLATAKNGSSDCIYAKKGATFTDVLALVANTRELTSGVNLSSASASGSEDMTGGLFCSKALKDHKRRILQRSDMIYYCCYNNRGIITICRQWKHECHCDYLESHNKVTCLTK